LQKDIQISDLNETRILSKDLQKDIQISDFTKIRPVETELFHTDGQRAKHPDGHDEANSWPSQFCDRA
jgi:hypothetical protein